MMRTVAAEAAAAEVVASLLLMNQEQAEDTGIFSLFIFPDRINAGTSFRPLDSGISAAGIELYASFRASARIGFSIFGMVSKSGRVTSTSRMSRTR